MLKELHMVKVWSWSIRKNVSKGKGGVRREEEIISLLLVQMISLTDEIFSNRTALEKLPVHLINGVGGITQRVYWDIYNRYYPFCSEICHKDNMLENVSMEYNAIACSTLEYSMNYKRRTMNITAELQKIKKRFVLDIGFYYSMSSKLVLSENVTVHLKDLLPSIIDTKNVEISNYAMDALVYLVQHGMMYEGKKMIPLTGHMSSFDNILVRVAVLSHDGDLRCTIQDGVKIFDLSDLHVYYFFQNRNIYIPVVEEYPMYENESFLEVKEEEMDFLKNHCPIMSIRNLVMIQEILMVLAQFYLPGVTGGFDREFHAGKSNSILLWYPMRELNDLRMLMFYMKIHCPWIKNNSCSQLYHKNMFGLFDPYLTEHEYYLQSNYWNEIHRKSVPEHIQLKSMEIRKYYDTKTRFERGLYSEYKEADERFIRRYQKFDDKTSNRKRRLDANTTMQISQEPIQKNCQQNHKKKKYQAGKSLNCKKGLRNILKRLRKNLHKTLDVLQILVSNNDSGKFAFYFVCFEILF